MAYNDEYLMHTVALTAGNILRDMIGVHGLSLPTEQAVNRSYELAEKLFEVGILRGHIIKPNK